LDKAEEFVGGLRELEHRLSELSRGGSLSDFERLKSDLRDLSRQFI